MILSRLTKKLGLLHLLLILAEAKIYSLLCKKYASFFRALENVTPLRHPSSSDNDSPFGSLFL